MEPEHTDPPRPEAAPRTELRALAQLRDRVEAAAQEVERLREENAALAARVAELQAEGPTGGGQAAVPLALAEGEDVEKLKAQIQSFIDAIDQMLNASEPPAAARGDG